MKPFVRFGRRFSLPATAKILRDLKTFIAEGDLSETPSQLRASEPPSATDFDNADLNAMQRAFDGACQEMRLGLDRPDARAVIARAVFAAYKLGQRGDRKLNEAAWEARSFDRLRNISEIDKTAANIAKQRPFSYMNVSTLAD